MKPLDFEGISDISPQLNFNPLRISEDKRFEISKEIDDNDQYRHPND